jgi:hypothetical protein
MPPASVKVLAQLHHGPDQLLFHGVEADAKFASNVADRKSVV